MITTCTVCQTRYRLDATRVPPRRIRVRCPDCGGVFDLDQAAQRVIAVIGAHQRLVDLRHPPAEGVVLNGGRLAVGQQRLHQPPGVVVLETGDALQRILRFDLVARRVVGVVDRPLADARGGLDPRQPGAVAARGVELVAVAQDLVAVGAGLAVFRKLR